MADGARWLNIDGTHRYLSTACLHATEPGRDALHRECQVNMRRYDGSHKHGAHCKFCDTPCICPCHQSGATDVQPA